MIYIFKYKIFRYIFLPNIPPPPFYPIHWITNTKLGIAKLSLRMTIQCWVFQSFPMPFKVRTHACSLTASYCPHPLSNSGETLLRSGLNMQKEASLKTHVSLSHYLNQQRESLETLLIYLSSAPSPPPVPHPPVSSQNFRKGRTPIRVRLYQFNLRNIPPWSCSAIYGVEYGFWMCLNTV